MSSALLFLKKWFVSPFKIGSITPSSTKLCNTVVQKMLEYKLSYNRILVVGVGTGPLLQSLRKYNIEPEKVTSVEIDEDMCLVSSRKFPEFNIINGDILTLSEMIQVKFDIVLSALPLTIMDNKNELISAMTDFMTDNGILVQYSYRLYSPIDVNMHNLCIKDTKKVYLNLPPANVWVYSK